MTQKFRRVVTGHDKNGVAVVESDQTAEHILQRPNRPGVTLTNFWLSDSTPAEYDGDVETCKGSFILHPPTHGSAFRCVEFLPEDPEVLAKLDGSSAFAEMGAGANIVEGARHPFMHRTDSLDYAIIMSGEIYMLMDEEDVLLKAGDVVVQRGTNHAWSNRGTEPCVIAFVLIDGVTSNDAEPEFKKGIPPR
ncbi:cupin domain-containing protein [Marinomonas sp. GJ51-6]|uniref:cupin domain-containing protein n=1 Tax=Marinomonas sp. GJ51-6 TaxID=2992802 RepID=UPI0029347CEB|nr:cupin domain-containing protein [Marinomonas sp. GJ51-6]WOD06307.1 cupin domain-containing protein [Marinomonas sp. GJ51-6]